MTAINNLITIKGGSYDDVKKALRQWIDLYADDLEPGLRFELYRSGRGSHVIKVVGRVDNERFNYLVNWLHYPENIVYNVSIEGFSVADDPKLFPADLLNKRIMVFVSPSDKEGDNVSVVSEDNKVYKVDFGGTTKATSELKTFIAPDIGGLTNPEIVKPVKARISKSENLAADIEKRFRLVSLIALGLIVLNLVTLVIDKSVFLSVTLYLNIMLGFWFFGDYRMLQIDRYYFGSVIISILVLGHGLLIQKNFSSEDVTVVKLGSLCPLTLLVLQRPARYLYKMLLNREPVVDEPVPTFWDFVYAMILFFLSLVLPFVIVG